MTQANQQIGNLLDECSWPADITGRLGVNGPAVRDEILGGDPPD
jgi:hypothetical protein